MRREWEEGCILGFGRFFLYILANKGGLKGRCLGGSVAGVLVFL